MADSDSLHFAPPHTERLLRRLRALDEPLIQIWGWPGTGRSALLEALLATEGEQALGLSAGDLSGEAEIRAALASARGGRVRYLVASTCTPEQAATAAHWLTPGQHLVFATERRLDLELSTAVIPPQELLLEAGELASLWHLVAGAAPASAVIEGLRAASDGWYLPLRLALEATGGGGLAGGNEETLLTVPSVRSFFRHEVLGGLANEERELLLAITAERDTWESADRLVAGWRTLVESRGLWVERPTGEGPPRLLAAYLSRLHRRSRKTTRSQPPASLPTPATPATPATAPPPMPANHRDSGARGGTAEPPLSDLVYRLGLLGDPFVRQSDGEDERELDWRLKRSFQVLAFLASSPGLQAGREDLIEAVWPREGERTIDRNFHPTLSHLRRSLEAGRRGGVPPPLLFRAGVYRLNPEIRWEIDLLEFRRLIEDGRAALDAADPRGEEATVEVWSQAWKLYRGPFLQGHYDAWLSPRRESYHKLYLDLLRDLGDLYVRLGRSEEAMDAYRAVLVEDPLQERIHIEVMRLYAGQGRRDFLRKQYDKLSRQLFEELGVEPLPGTQEEYHRLLAALGPLA